jgi:hypothetical protein
MRRIASAVRRGRRKLPIIRMDCAFEAIEPVSVTSRHDLKVFVIVVPARVTLSHGEPLFERLPVSGNPRKPRQETTSQ